MASFGRREALIIGINEYTDSPLSCSVRDAEAMADLLRMPEYGFFVSVLIDADATRRQIFQKISEIEALQPDLFLIYFSGHGCKTEIDNYLVTIDAEPFKEGVELSVLMRTLDRLARRSIGTIALLDCCHAGAATLVNGALPINTADMESAVSGFQLSRVILAACRPEQFAFEDPSAGHSLFTSYLLEGMLGEAADFEGTVSVHSLYDYVCKPFQDATNQSPVFRADLAGRFILAESLPPRLGRPVEATVKHRVRTDARAQLDRYNVLRAVGHDEWHRSGYRAAAQWLESTLGWFQRQFTTFPQLKNDREFMELYLSATSQLHSFASLSPGINLREGVVAESLGSGGFGTVWKIVPQDPALPTLAFKVYHSRDLDHAEKRARFTHGYDAMKRLDHPRVVRVFHATRTPVGFFMAFIDGPNLRDFGAINDPSDLIEMLLSIAETIRHAHSREVIHRDIKPENIILNFDSEAEKWVPYLTDFDLAWFTFASTLTQQEGFGNMYYAAPEQITLRNSKRARSELVDIFSFGQLLYFAATGVDPVPLAAAEKFEQHLAVLRTRAESWTSERAGRIFIDLYRNCVRHAQRDRLQSITEVIDHLAAAQQALRTRLTQGRFTVPELIQEVIFSIVGLDYSGKSPDFTSVTGRTKVLMRSLGTAYKDQRGYEVARLEAEIAPTERPSMEGLDGDAIRKELNRRIDTNLAAYAGVKRHAAAHGPFGVIIVFDSVELNASGVEFCRAVITRTIDTIERA